MALTEWNAAEPAFDPARDAASALPTDALARLPSLTRELNRDFVRQRLLARSPLACLVLMIATGGALLLTSPAIKPGFGWAVLLLIGIVGMVRNFIRGAARTLRRVPLEEAAHDQMALLLYSGAAWASGAWLLMPDNPPAALVFTFAAAPALSLALILKDVKATAAFTLPVMAGVAGAAILGAWPLDIWVAIAICAAGFGIILLPALQQTQPTSPAGLTLR